MYYIDFCYCYFTMAAKDVGCQDPDVNDAVPDPQI